MAMSQADDVALKCYIDSLGSDWSTDHQYLKLCDNLPEDCSEDICNYVISKLPLCTSGPLDPVNNPKRAIDQQSTGSNRSNFVENYLPAKLLAFESAWAAAAAKGYTRFSTDAWPKDCMIAERATALIAKYHIIDPYNVRSVAVASDNLPFYRWGKDMVATAITDGKYREHEKTQVGDDWRNLKDTPVQEKLDDELLCDKRYAIVNGSIAVARYLFSEYGVADISRNDGRFPFTSAEIESAEMIALLLEFGVDFDKSQV